MISKMVSFRPQLSLDCKPTSSSTFVPKTITEFLAELATNGSVSETVTKVNDFVKRLEEEMRKIEAFKRELPLCMILLNDAIRALKEESTQCKRKNVEPVLEEFIPIKKTCDEIEKDDVRKEKDSRDKMNWMRSVQLWNCEDHSVAQFCDRKQNSVAENKQRAALEDNQRLRDDPFQSIKKINVGNSFTPFSGYSVSPLVKEEDKRELPVPGLSLLTPLVVNNQREELGSSSLRSNKSSGSKESSSSAPSGHQSTVRMAGTLLQTSRKQRRCWSPELHRRFVNALQQLGGPQVATPKQIRELMQVDGLTNDEVKSHLQKYRLHTRKLPGASAMAKANQALVVLGSLWTPSDQCGESSKASNSQSDSPQGPLQLNGGGGTSTTVGDSMEEDEEEDNKSESYNWKSHVQKSGEVTV